jgi:hypothetical protein
MKKMERKFKRSSVLAQTNETPTTRGQATERQQKHEDEARLHGNDEGRELERRGTRGDGKTILSCFFGRYSTIYILKMGNLETNE